MTLLDKINSKFNTDFKYFNENNKGFCKIEAGNKRMKRQIRQFVVDENKSRVAREGKGVVVFDDSAPVYHYATSAFLNICGVLKKRGFISHFQSRFTLDGPTYSISIKDGDKIKNFRSNSYLLSAFQKQKGFPDVPFNDLNKGYDFYKEGRNQLI